MEGGSGDMFVRESLDDKLDEGSMDLGAAFNQLFSNPKAFFVSDWSEKYLEMMESESPLEEFARRLAKKEARDENIIKTAILAGVVYGGIQIYNSVPVQAFSQWSGEVLMPAVGEAVSLFVDLGVRAAVGIYHLGEKAVETVIENPWIAYGALATAAIGKWAAHYSTDGRTLKDGAKALGGIFEDLACVLAGTAVLPIATLREAGYLGLDGAARAGGLAYNKTKRLFPWGTDKLDATGWFDDEDLPGERDLMDLTARFDANYANYKSRQKEELKSDFRAAMGRLKADLDKTFLAPYHGIKAEGGLAGYVLRN